MGYLVVFSVRAIISWTTKFGKYQYLQCTVKFLYYIYYIYYKIHNTIIILTLPTTQHSE